MMRYWKDELVDSVQGVVNYARDMVDKVNTAAGYNRPESPESSNRLRIEVPQQRPDILKIFEEPIVSLAGAKAGAIIDYCTETIQKSQQHLSTEDSKMRYLMNRHQCSVLIDCLSRALGIIKDEYDTSFEKKIPLLEELLHTYVDAETMIKSSCYITSSSQWPRAAVEKWSMEQTFSKFIENTMWYLQQILPSKRNDHLNELKMKNLKKMTTNLNRDLRTAAKLDAESLKERLKSTLGKMVGRAEKSLANQLLDRLESSSRDLLFVDPVDLGLNKGLTGTSIGNGASGAVMTLKFIGDECATKKIALWPGSTSVGSKLKKPFEKEIQAIKTLGNHPYIVRLFCYSLADDACFLLMERMHMDLLKLLETRHKQNAKLSIAEATSVMLQIAEGMKYIHGKGAAHRDLKPNNVLVNVEDRSRIRSVKIADFGQTKTTEAGRTLPDHTHNTGTTMYMAPEVILITGEDEPGKVDVLNPMKADVYSFGILCCQILTMQSPYEHGMTKDMKQKLKAGTLPRPVLPRRCPGQLATLIKRCWDGDRSKRPLFPDICNELRVIRGKDLTGRL